MNKEEKLKLAVQITQLEALRAIRIKTSEAARDSKWDMDKLFNGGETTTDAIKRNLEIVEKLLAEA